MDQKQVSITVTKAKNGYVATAAPVFYDGVDEDMGEMFVGKSEKTTASKAFVAAKGILDSLLFDGDIVPACCNEDDDCSCVEGEDF